MSKKKEEVWPGICLYLKLMEESETKFKTLPINLRYGLTDKIIKVEVASS